MELEFNKEEKWYPIKIVQLSNGETYIYEHPAELAEYFDGVGMNAEDSIFDSNSLPDEKGVYSLEIKFHDTSGWTESGYEYDCEILTRNLNRIFE